MSGGGRILEQDDPFADLVPAKQGEHDPFQDLVPAPKPSTAKLERPPVAASDATRVGAEPVGLAGQLQQHAPGQSGNFANDVAESVMEMATHPVETARALVETPFKGGEAVGEYVKGGRLNKGKGRAAAIGAAQTAAMLLTGPAEHLAEPVVARAIGARLAPLATRTAIGAVSGATFTPDRPGIGAVIGAAGGALSSKGVAAKRLQERIARFEQFQKEHPDWFSETPSTPAEAITNKNRILDNPNRPKADAKVIGEEPVQTEPDFTVEDPIRDLGPFKGALVEHGKAFQDAVENPPPAAAPNVEQLRQQESNLFNQQIEANRAAGWPEPSSDAVDHFGDQVFDISHEETARELWIHANDHFVTRAMLEDPAITGRKRDQIERDNRNADDAYNGMLSQYEDYFGPEGVQKFLEKTGLPGDLTGNEDTLPAPREFNDRISTGEAPTRADPAGVPGLVEKAAKSPPPSDAVPRGNPVTPEPLAPKKLEAAVKSPDGVVVSVPGKSLHLDPDRFQFKHQGIDSKSGAGAWVKGSKRYNPVLGGVWVTWIDPADGLEYVVNSHHRKAIWDNDITPGRPDNVNVLRIEAATAQEARAIGARINIAEGHGTPLDVAQFIRDSGLRPEDLEKEGISLRGDLARQGSALAQLTPDLLAKVGTGELAENHGVAIGEMLPGEPELQREVVGEVKRSGRRLSADDVREVARQVHAAGTTDVRQETLFGGEVGRRPLFVERAQLATAIMKKLGQDRRILGFVAQEQRAQILAKGGNVIDVEKSRELADQSGQLEELFERLYTREGPIAKVLTQAASRVAHGQKVKAVADDIYSAVAEAVGAEIKAGTGSGASDQNAEGAGSVQPGAAETGDVKTEEVFNDPNQEGFGIAEPQMRPETQASYNSFAARRKAAFLQAYRESKSVKLSAEAAGVGTTSVDKWRLKDPEFDKAIREIHEPHVGGTKRTAPTTKFDEQLPIAKRKAAYLEALRETMSVEKAAEKVGIDKTNVIYWRNTDAHFGVMEADIKPPRTFLKDRRLPPPPPPPPKPRVLEKIDIEELREHVAELRAAVERGGGFDIGRHRRAFNHEAAEIIKAIDTIEALEKARVELDDLADDFTPIPGLEEEQKQLHKMFADEEKRRSRGADNSPEAVAHRERQSRYEAKKLEAAEAAKPAAPVNTFVEIYRAAKEAKAARERLVKEGDKKPYQTDLFVGNADTVKPELRQQKPDKAWPFYKLHSKPASLGVGKTTKPEVIIWGGIFQGKVVSFRTQPRLVDPGAHFMTHSNARIRGEVANQPNYIDLVLESGNLTEKEFDELAQLAQLQDTERAIRYRRRGELLGAQRDVKVQEKANDHPYEHSSTQVNLPAKMADAIKQMAAKIPEEDLAENGREEFPHITIKYGLHGTDPEAVRKLLADEPPFDVDFGMTSYFPNGESGNGDVLKIDVDSPALHALNKKIADALPNTETHPKYQPHATVAYLKPGLGKEYMGDHKLSGRRVRVTSVVFSSKDGTQTRIKLGGKEEPAVVIFDKHGFLESKTAHEIDTIGNGHHSQTFSQDALNRQDLGVLAYKNNRGEVTVNVAATAGVSDKRIRDVVKEHWPSVIGKDVTIIRQNINANENSVVEDFRVWEKDLFGYNQGEESLFADEETGKAGPPKPTEGGYKAKAKEARDRADFLKKQLARLQKSLETFDHAASANNRPANDLARNIDALRKEIADLDRIANFAEKLTTEEIKLQVDKNAAPEIDDKSLDMFKEPDIEPARLTAAVLQLEKLVDELNDSVTKIGQHVPDEMAAEYQGLKAGIDRIMRELRDESRIVEKQGAPTKRFLALVREWNGISSDYESFMTELQSHSGPGGRHFPGDMQVWEEGKRNGYWQPLHEFWADMSPDARRGMLRKWRDIDARAFPKSPELHRDFADKYAIYPVEDLPDHVRQQVDIERQLMNQAMRQNGIWEDPSQLHLFYTYGSVEKAEAAAQKVVETSGKYVTLAHAQEIGKKVLSSRQRKRNVETARKGAFVDIVGKKITGAHDIAQLLHNFRSPEMERFSVIMTDAAGKVLAHTMETSGVINYSVVPEKLAKTIARRARVVGASHVHFGHNHPSGDPTPSPEDKRMTAELAYQLKRRGLILVDHVITNHRKYGWIRPGDDVERTGGTITVGNDLPYDEPALADRTDWTMGHGGVITHPNQVAGLAAHALQGEDFGALYVTSQGHAVALEPRPAGDLKTLQTWLKQALKDHAAAQVAIVFNPEVHGTVISDIVDKLENFPSLAHGLFDIVSFDGKQSLLAMEPFAFMGFRGESPIIPQPSKRLIGEGRNGYNGGRTDGPAGKGEDRSKASNANDRSAGERAAVPQGETGVDRRSTEPAELHDPKLDRSANIVARMAYELRRLFTPAVLTRESAQTARVLRAASGRMSHRRELASHALRQFSRELTRLSPEDRFAFMHQIETGEKVTTTPGMTAAAAELRKQLDTVRDRVRGLGTGKLENFIENYLPHIYKDPKRARTIIQQMMQRRPFEGNKSWLKKRSIETLKDAMEMGLEPITDNPVDLALLRIFQMNRYVMAHEIMQELKAKGPQFLKFVGAHEKPPAGFVQIDDSAFTVFGRPAVPIEEAFDPVLRGHLEAILKRLGGKHARTVNMPGQQWGSAAGNNVRTKFGGDIGVLMHEIGHVLDDKFDVWDKLHEPIEQRTVTRGKKKGQSVPTKDAIAYRAKITKELRELADLRIEGQDPDQVSEHHKKYIRNRAEKIANAIHALVYMPDRMAGVAPTVKAALEQLLQGTPAADILNPKRSVTLGTGVAEKGIYGTLITGKYYAPEAVATVVNNFLSPGLRGNPLYDAYMGIGNTLNQVQLGLSFFHLGFTSLDAMVSKLALSFQQTARGQFVDAGKSLALFPFAAATNFVQGFQVYRAYLDPARAGKYDQVVEAIERAGGKIKMDDFYKNDHWKKLVEGYYHKDPITVAARIIPAAFEASSRFILEFVVPRQKLGVFADMFMMEARRLGPDATEDELRRAAQRAWDSTDNRMGQMVYDNLMWNRVLKDSLMGLVRAVGWDLGTFRELIGGGKDIVALPHRAVTRRLRDRRSPLLAAGAGDVVDLADGQGGDSEGGAPPPPPEDRPDPLFTHKAAYLLALFAGVGALGAALNKGMTGEWPKEMRDLWTPRTGKMNDEGNPERVELPSYVKDVFAYARHPVQTALHKLHPLLNYIVSVLQNEDYYGDMVRNPDDPAFLQFEQEVKYLLKQFQPFGFRNAQEQAKRNQSKPVMIGNFIGITPAKRADTRTPAENKIADLLRRKGRSGLTPEESEERQGRGIIRAGKREGKPKGSVIADAMRSSPLTHREAVQIWAGTGKNTQLEQFKRLDYPEAQQVWDLASAEERRRWNSVYVQKRANYRAEHGLKKAAR